MTSLKEAPRTEISRGLSSSSSMMPFIVSSTVNKVDPVTRKLIRSHVMRGKKQKKSRHDGERKPKRVNMAERTHTTPIKLEEVIETYAPLCPGRIGSDLSFIEFPDEIEPWMLLNMKRMSTFATRVFFPLMATIGFRAENRESLYPLVVDAAALHITAFSVEGFVHRVLRRQKGKINPAAMLHLEKGLIILRKRLLGEDDEIKISDSTMGVVLKLASAAHFDGDFQTSRKHLEGLRQMINLRGGIHVFEGSRLLNEIFRCDLSTALLGGSGTIFITQASQPVQSYPEKLLPSPAKNIHLRENIELLQNMDADLATSWQVLSHFCLLVNIGTQTQRLIRQEMIHETMTAVMYRLLHMKFAPNSIDATIRLGLLAFSHHIFLQWQDIRPSSAHFPTIYRNCLLKIKIVDGVSSHFMLWLLMAGAISLYDIAEEVWLGKLVLEYIKKIQVKTWKEMQNILKSFMWIPLLDEQPGQKIFDLLDAHE